MGGREGGREGERAGGRGGGKEGSRTHGVARARSEGQCPLLRPHTALLRRTPADVRLRGEVPRHSIFDYVSNIQIMLMNISLT